MSYRLNPIGILVLAVIVLSFLAALAAMPGKPVQPGQGAQVEKRIDDLLAQMTLKEKLGQMNMPCVYERGLGRDTAGKMENCKRFIAGTYVAELGPGGGLFTLANTVLYEGPRQQANFHNELQKIALEQTRLKIPVLQSEEGTHGIKAAGHTIFPEGPGIGSAWDVDLVKEVYAAAAREARSVGIHQIYTLVVEPNRDPRLGRNEEGYSEDPYLCSRIAEAIVHGAQGGGVSSPDKVVAGLCHYPGQSEPVSGFERGAMEISERMLREVFLPPWVAGIKKAGALGVMATYPAIDGIPTHASTKILTSILRGELGFEGLVLGEGGGITTNIQEHVSANQADAGALALKAGLDVGISWEDGYMKGMIENLETGRVSMDLIDRAVRRILRQKFALGLFDRPYVDPENAVKTVHTQAHQDLALRVAQEGIVLLKNDGGLLPLRKDLKSIAVIGPNADNDKNQLGDYISDHAILQKIVTPLEGIRQKIPARVLYARGCDVFGDDRSGFDEAVRAAREADVSVVVLGENWRYSPNKGSNGEGRDIASLDLTGAQEDLLRAVYAAGKPVVLVLINGRPLSVRWAAEKAPAIVEAWLPGELGGRALADILFGDFNPGGRLPITVPRHAGQLPSYYNVKPSKAQWVDGKIRYRDYVDMPGSPLWPFGYGLSYTKFEYGNLKVTPAEIGPAGEVRVSAEITNSGAREGSEVVQLYIHDVVSSVTRPIEELKGFRKMTLRPGERRTLEFTLGFDELSFLDRNLERVVEPGTFRVMLGSSCQDIRLSGSFEVRSTTR